MTTETLLAIQLWIGLIAGSLILLVLAVGLPIAAVAGAVAGYRNCRTWAAAWCFGWFTQEQRQVTWEAYRWDLSDEDRATLGNVTDRFAAGIIRRSRELALGPAAMLDVGDWVLLSNGQKANLVMGYGRGGGWGARLAGEDIVAPLHRIRPDGVMVEQPGVRVVKTCPPPTPAEEVVISSGIVMDQPRRTVPQLIEALASSNRSAWIMRNEERDDLVEALRLSLQAGKEG